MPHSRLCAGGTPTAKMDLACGSPCLGETAICGDEAFKHGHDQPDGIGGGLAALAGQQIVQRQLQVAPTLTIRPGFPVRIIVTRDLVFEPAGG